MADRREAQITARVIALACIAVVVLLFRMATNGTFVHLYLDLRTPAWAVVTVTGILVALAATALAIILALWPHPRLLVPSLILGAFIVPFSLVLVHFGHDSGRAVAVIGVAIVVLTAYVLMVVTPRSSDT